MVVEIFFINIALEITIYKSMNNSTQYKAIQEKIQDTCSISINPLIFPLKDTSLLNDNFGGFVDFPKSVAREILTTPNEYLSFLGLIPSKSYEEITESNEQSTSNDYQKACLYIKDKLKPVTNFSINCDWLEFWGTCYLKGLTNNYNVDTNLFYEISNKFYLTNFKNMNSAYYSTICDIYKMSDVENIKVATLVFNPKSCKNSTEQLDNEIFKDQVSKCNLQIINRCLYEMNVSELIQDLFQDLNYKALSITRLDIAYDNTENIVNIVKDIDNNELPLLLKKQGQINTQRTQRNGSFTGYKIGTSMSDKQVVCYNKSRELRKVKDKDYIKQSWTDSSIDYEDTDIWRTEFRFRGKALKKLDITVNDFINNIDQKQFLYEVSKKLNANMLQLKLRYKARIEGKSTTKTEIFDLLPNLELKYGIQKKEIETNQHDWYKIKLSLHLAYKMMLFGTIDIETFNQQIKYLFSLDANAEEWFATKSGIDTYSKFNIDQTKTTWYEKYKKEADLFRKKEHLNNLELDRKKEMLELYEKSRKN